MGTRWLGFQAKKWSGEKFARNYQEKEITQARFTFHSSSCLKFHLEVHSTLNLFTKNPETSFKKSVQINSANKKFFFLIFSSQELLRISNELITTILIGLQDFRNFYWLKPHTLKSTVNFGHLNRKNKSNCFRIIQMKRIQFCVF